MVKQPHPHYSNVNRLQAQATSKFFSVCAYSDHIMIISLISLLFKLDLALAVAVYWSITVLGTANFTSFMEPKPLGNSYANSNGFGAVCNVRLWYGTLAVVLELAESTHWIGFNISPGFYWGKRIVSDNWLVWLGRVVLVLRAAEVLRRWNCGSWWHVCDSLRSWPIFCAAADFVGLWTIYSIGVDFRNDEKSRPTRITLYANISSLSNRCVGVDLRRSIYVESLSRDNS